MRLHWLYLCWAAGSLLVGQAITHATAVPLFSFFGLLGAISCGAVAIFHASDPDPAYNRVAVSEQEKCHAAKRLQWVDQTVLDLAVKARIRPLRATKFANAGIYYKFLRHRVMISRAMCARLSDSELRLILAHEVGHATRRYAGFDVFRESTRIAEELRADEMALGLTGASADDWLHAMQAAMRAEGHDGNPRELSARLVALGFDHAALQASTSC